jgi:hypothetical protein
MSNKKILVIGDTQVKPGHCNEYIRHIGEYIVDKRPDEIVCIGDWFDFESLSSYDRGKRSFEGRRIVEDIKAGKDAMDILFKPLRALAQQQKSFKKKVYNPKLTFCCGNHEDRFDRVANDMPEFHGLTGVKTLNLESYGWEVHDFLKPVEIDGIFFVHFLANPFTGKPYAGTALAQLKTVGRSFVVGHKQCLDIGIHPRIDGSLQIGIINGACLTPDHKVLHADLTYREIGDLVVGDKLVSFEEDLQGRRGRRFKTGTVQAVKRDMQEVFAVKLSSGKVFKVTGDHKWVVKQSGKYVWRETSTLRKGTRIPKFLDEWETLQSYDAGWLSGIYDGEGCYTVRNVGVCTEQDCLCNLRFVRL